MPSLNAPFPTLQSTLDHLPEKPGVYLMKSSGGDLLYIGKARVLADRVRSYFQTGTDVTPKTQLLMAQVGEIETIVTRSDLEALILESNLIKRHRPKFNVVLRDDKQYPYLRLPIKESFPRLSIVRRVCKDGALYFGPYTPAGALRETLKVIRKVFPLATCDITIDGTADRACLEFEIKRCMAPCTGNQSSQDYHRLVEQVRKFLEGRDHELVEEVRGAMESAAAHEEFEEAARLRDRLHNIQRTLEKQRITQTAATDQDVIGLAREGAAVDIQLFFVRGGLLIGRKDFFWADAFGLPDEELVGSVIEQFYNNDGLPPKELLVPIPLGEASLIETWLTEQRGTPVRVVAPERGIKHQLVLLAEENAVAGLSTRLREQETTQRAVAELQRLLRLDHPPNRIEGFDISNIMGAYSVASMVVWEGGKMKTKEYRHFRINTVTGANDCASIQEAVLRRYGHLQDMALPDLILIDGGLGQVGAAREALKHVGLSPVPIFGLAKARRTAPDATKQSERMFLPGRKNPILLSPTSPTTHLVQLIRDEAHRFAVAHHRRIRNRAALASPIDQIPGIGTIRRTRLLREFGSLENIARATDEKLQQIGKINQHTASAIRKSLKHLR